MNNISYTLFYIPKNLKGSLKYSNYVVKMQYLPKGVFLYIIPKGILPFVIKKNNLLLIVANKFSKFKLKPYYTSLIINILGLTFRFKLFARVRGLGYKAYILNSGKTLNLKLGLSHTVNFNFLRDMFATKLGQKDRMFSIEGSN